MIVYKCFSLLLVIGRRETEDCWQFNRRRKSEQISKTDSREYGGTAKDDRKQNEDPSGGESRD